MIFGYNSPPLTTLPLTKAADTSVGIQVQLSGLVSVHYSLLKFKANHYISNCCVRQPANVQQHPTASQQAQVIRGELAEEEIVIEEIVIEEIVIEETIIGETFMLPIYVL